MRGAERRSNPGSVLGASGLLRFARNDGERLSKWLYATLTPRRQPSRPPTAQRRRRWRSRRGG
ncbi:hypothetical protein DY468_12300 [Rhodopseudomonas sp. BR0M22]|nr:hypothetical protein [Rhodopseudomonas sp. BR0M22]